MELAHDICYRALRTRDARFDGRFFTGVTSTGVYCRPVCPAQTPKPTNCSFFACAAAAEEAGFRPCRRCRPETSPGTPAWRGTSATVARALRLIEDGALDAGGVEELASRLGVGDRHLRRLFAEHLGASPLAVAHTRRVHFAKRMIEETALSMTRIALAAGFNNVRRFNGAIRRSFARTPTEIRQRSHAGNQSAGDGTITLRLAYRRPFDWDGLLAWMKPRMIPKVEHVEGDIYRRTVSLDGFVGVIELGPASHGAPALLLRTPIDAAPVMSRIAGRLRTLCDLDADPAAITDQLGTDCRLEGLARLHPGVRVPGFWDRFELAVRAILGQQVSIAGATVLAGKLAARFGRSVADSGILFPGPNELAGADIASIGMPVTRAHTIQSLARAICAGQPVLELAPDLATAIGRLTALPGIGDWTAQYIAMRALREPDAFPAGDLGLRKALANETDVAAKQADERLPSAATVRNRAETWRPWRAYAAMLLWREPVAARRKDSP